MGRLTDKVALVTGAGSGQGFATTLEMANEGANVVAVDINQSGLDKLAEAHGRLPVNRGALLTRRCDVSSSADVRAAVECAVGDFGALHVMCNCAAIAETGSVLDTSEETLQRTLAINVKGVFYGCKFAIEAMRRCGGGSIINWGSINSLIAEPGLAAYCASKGAVLMLTKAAAADYAQDNIRVNCICPGSIDTPLNYPYYETVGGREAYEEKLRERQPLGMGSPEQIARVAVFLASDDSSLITGAAIMADGGYSAL